MPPPGQILFTRPVSAKEFALRVGAVKTWFFPQDDSSRMLCPWFQVYAMIFSAMAVLCELDVELFVVCSSSAI